MRVETVRLDEGDYLTGMGGGLDQDSFVVYIVLETKAGRSIKLGQARETVGFRFKIGRGEVPGTVYGAVVETPTGLRLCQLGCEVIPE
jgi:hypothetical protein